MHQFHLFLVWGALQSATHALITLCNALLHGPVLEEHLEFSAGEEWSDARAVKGMSWYTFVLWVALDANLLPGEIEGAGCYVWSSTWHRALVIYGTTWLIQFYRVGRLQCPLIKQWHLSGLWKHTFFVAAPVLWNVVPSEIQIASILLLFRRTMKTWFFT